ncbi:MAG: hypothetical protein P8130_13280 [Deltaproteobacteria bacterium]
MNSLKPAASIKTHLLVAAILWSAVGVFLCVRGYLLMRPNVSYIAILAGIVVGTAKSLLVLDKTARKNIQRILAFEESTCIGGVYSWKTWVLVLGMIIGGRLLRQSSLPSSLVGGIYVAVGWALAMSSRIAWQQWRS